MTPSEQDPTFADIHVLFVDGDADTRRRAERTLARAFRVTCVASAEAARAKLGERAWNAVVAEQRLPDGSGAAILAEARASSTRCACVLVSHDEVRHDDAGDKPWDYLLKKPFNPFTLQRVVESYTLGAAYEGSVLGL